MINELTDDNSFEKLYIAKKVKTRQFLTLKNQMELSNAVTVGVGLVSHVKVLFIQLNKEYKIGTIGTIEGEKITLAFEYATKRNLPIIAVVASGGIRVQESTPALIQMAKISAAVNRHSNKCLFYVSIVTNPTLGGASASFVSLADIIIAEKGATYGFSGKRIIEDTTHEKLPDDFQTAEYAKRHGMVDIVADKDDIKSLIGKLLQIHTR